ncbi:MAG: hypothetical protein NTY90_04665 [Candidatus Micrarchaeota archaeon]|nr:hypothetical protein [Candidatus Micrarchaeota archaeon]
MTLQGHGVFAKPGMKEHAVYAKLREAGREELRKKLGEKYPSPGRVGDFVTGILSKATGSGAPKDAAKQLLLKHVSPVDVFLSKPSVTYGVERAARLELEPKEKPVAALLIARAHHALENVHRDREAAEALLRAVAGLEGKRVSLEKIYETVMKKRLAPSRAAVDEHNIYGGRELDDLRNAVLGGFDVPESLWLAEHRLAELKRLEKRFPEKK